MKAAIAVSVACALSCLSVSAEEADRVALPDKIEMQPLKGVLPNASRTVLGVVIGKHDLKDIKRRLGDAPIKKLEAEEGHPMTVCYRSNRPNDDTMVLFEAGPLGGFQTTTAVLVGPASKFGPSYDCLATAKVSRSTAKAGKLHLGGDIQSIAGGINARPIAAKSGLTELALERIVTRGDKASGKRVEVDVSSGVVARVEQGSVKWFAVYYTESL